MNKAEEILKLLNEMSAAELQRNISFKVKVHNMEVAIRDLENNISMDKNPETKKHKMDRLAAKKAALSQLKASH